MDDMKEFVDFYTNRYNSVMSMEGMTPELGTPFYISGYSTVSREDAEDKYDRDFARFDKNNKGIKLMRSGKHHFLEWDPDREVDQHCCQSRGVFFESEQDIWRDGTRYDSTLSVCSLGLAVAKPEGTSIAYGDEPIREQAPDKTIWYELLYDPATKVDEPLLETIVQHLDSGIISGSLSRDDADNIITALAHRYKVGV